MHGILALIFKAGCCPGTNLDNSASMPSTHHPCKEHLFHKACVCVLSELFFLGFLMYSYVFYWRM